MRIVGHMAAWAAVVTLVALPAAAMAQARGSVPNQSWYPAGYVDLREAAASQAGDFPRDPRVVLMEDWDDPNLKLYDVVDCNLAYDLPYDMDPYERHLGALAIDVARMRHELAQLGYAREVYDQPLLDYERAVLETMEAPEELAAAARKLDPNSEEYDGFSGGAELQDWELLGVLAEAMEERRARLNPRLPRIVSEGGCGAGESEFEIRMVPANGELWLINAFAFRVCERKVANPWDHNACAWTQYQEGDSTFASGRYMYEARWGSTVKRGARELQGDPADEDVTQITFRR